MSGVGGWLGGMAATGAAECGDGGRGLVGEERVRADRGVVGVRLLGGVRLVGHTESCGRRGGAVVRPCERAGRACGGVPRDGRVLRGPADGVAGAASRGAANGPGGRPVGPGWC